MKVFSLLVLATTINGSSNFRFELPSFVVDFLRDAGPDKTCINFLTDGLAKPNVVFVPKNPKSSATAKVVTDFDTFRLDTEKLQSLQTLLDKYGNLAPVDLNNLYWLQDSDKFILCKDMIQIITSDAIPDGKKLISKLKVPDTPGYTQAGKDVINYIQENKAYFDLPKKRSMIKYFKTLFDDLTRRTDDDVTWARQRDHSFGDNMKTVLRKHDPTDMMKILADLEALQPDPAYLAQSNHGKYFHEDLKLFKLDAPKIKNIIQYIKVGMGMHREGPIRYLKTNSDYRQLYNRVHWIVLNGDPSDRALAIRDLKALSPAADYLLPSETGKRVIKYIDNIRTKLDAKKIKTILRYTNPSNTVAEPARSEKFESWPRESEFDCLKDELKRMIITFEPDPSDIKAVRRHVMAL